MTWPAAASVESVSENLSNITNFHCPDVMDVHDKVPVLKMLTLPYHPDVVLVDDVTFACESELVTPFLVLPWQ